MIHIGDMYTGDAPQSPILRVIDGGEMENKMSKREEQKSLLSELALLFPNGFCSIDAIEKSEYDPRLRKALCGKHIGNIATTNSLGMFLMYRHRATTDKEFRVTKHGKRFNTNNIIWKVERIK